MAMGERRWIYVLLTMPPTWGPTQITISTSCHLVICSNRGQRPPKVVLKQWSSLSSASNKPDIPVCWYLKKSGKTHPSIIFSFVLRTWDRSHAYSLEHNNTTMLTGSPGLRLKNEIKRHEKKGSKI